MENKSNNKKGRTASKKVTENLIPDPSIIPDPYKSTNIKKTVKTVKTQTPKTKKAVKVNTEKVKKQSKSENLTKKTEQEKIKAKKRLEMAKLKEERNIQKQKTKEAKKLAAKRKAEAVHESKMLKKQKQQERREMLKHESKEQKQRRLNEKKAETARKNKEKKLIAQKRKQEKIAEKEQKKQKNSKKSNSYAGWLTAVIALGVSVLALGSMLTIMYTRQAGTNSQLSNVYEKSFYDLVSYVDNLDINLSKLQVANSESEQQKLLTNVVVQAELAENNIQQLPIADESKNNTAGFINSIGDYARSLINKIAKGETLNDEEKENLDKLYSIISNLKTELSSLSYEIDSKYRFIELLKKNEDDMILNKFSELENNSVEYPKLIYDGPFSAGLEGLDAKGLQDFEEIDAASAIEKYKEYFKNYNIQDVNVTGEANGKYFVVYNVEGTMTDGHILYAQLSKKGGKLIMFNMYSDCTTQNFDTERCTEIADKYLSAIGLNDMKAVWINDSGNIANINYAYTVGSTIVYSDLIKIKVCQEQGKVIGLEAMSYYLNHTDTRSTDSAISVQQARENVSSKIDIETQRLTIIPTKGGSETLAYEFMGTYNDSTYYVYIDAKTGKEAEVFKVVKTTEGNLLM